MDKYFVAGLADGRERGIAYGRATDGFSNMEQSLDFFESIMLAQNNVDSNAVGNNVQSVDLFESIMHEQNNEGSNAIMAQPGAPVPQATLVASTSMPNQDKAAKRREKDKAYRQRLKKHKTEMEGNMKALTQENEALEVEVRALQAENTRLDQAFQSRGQEMDKLKHDLNRLMAEHKRQDVLVNGLSDKLVGSDFSLRDEEIQKLKDKSDLLRKGKGMEGLCLQLMKENAKLKLQLDAVCDKFLAENPSPVAKFTV